MVKWARGEGPCLPWSRAQRTQIPAPFKRSRAAYTYHFEEWVLELLAGLSVEEVSRRLSVSTEMVEGIREHRLESERAIPPDAEITSIEMET